MHERTFGRGSDPRVGAAGDTRAGGERRQPVHRRRPLLSHRDPSTDWNGSPPRLVTIGWGARNPLYRRTDVTSSCRLTTPTLAAFITRRASILSNAFGQQSISPQPRALSTCYWSIGRRRYPPSLAGRRSPALIHRWRPSASRTRPHHSRRSFTHQSSWPAFDRAVITGRPTNQRPTAPVSRPQRRSQRR